MAFGAEMYRKQDIGEDRLRELWFEHQDKEGWFDSLGDDPEKRVRALFGSPPYEFLRLGDPVPPVFRGTRNRLVQATDGRDRIRPELSRRIGQANYSALPKRAAYTDQLGRHYWVKSRDQRAIVLKFRLPIALKRRGVGLPEPGERLSLYGNPAISGTVESTNIKPGYSTGEVELG